MYIHIFCVIIIIVSYIQNFSFCMFVCLHVCAYVCVFACVYVYVCVYVCVCVHVCGRRMDGQNLIISGIVVVKKPYLI